MTAVAPSRRLRALADATVGVLALATLAARPTAGAPPRAAAAFRATDYAFTGPDTVDAGVVAVRLDNAGREPHQLNLYRLAADADPAAVMRALLANRARPAGVVKLGGVEGVRAGGVDSVVVPLAPGRYVLVCGLPSPDGRAHAEKGMLRLLVVRGAASGPLVLPPADVTLRLTEYDVALSRPLRAGRQRLRVENGGRQAHHLIVARLHPGVTKATVDAWDGRGAPPFDDVGGVAALDPGQANVWTVTLRPGTYLLSCAVPDAGDRRPHYAHGMERVVVIGGGR